MNILAVDDDPDYLELLEAQFREAGMQMTTCTSGPHALELLDRQPFDVVVVDLVMPVMDGRTLAKQIRGRPRHAGLPIVMMTHMGNVASIAAARPGDLHHFVNKSEPSGLIGLVAQLVGRRIS
jgi:CheY-like chemotaxis protein